MGVVLPMDRSGHVNPHLPIDLRANRAFGDFQVEVDLQPDPELEREAKVFAQSERSVCGDSTLPIDDLADAPWRTAISPASLLMLMAIGFMNSSKRISPG